MQPAARVFRYVAVVYAVVAALAAIVVDDPAWTIAAAISAVVVPMGLVVVGIMVDPQGPHRPDSGAGGRLRRSPARSA